MWKISCAVCDMYKKNMSVGKMEVEMKPFYGLLRTEKSGGKQQ